MKRVARALAAPVCGTAIGFTVLYLKDGNLNKVLVYTALTYLLGIFIGALEEP